MGDLLVLGAHGQVGRAVVALAQHRGVPHRALSRADCDITDQSALQARIQPGDFVINCAAYTAVDRAESEPHAAHVANADLPLALAIVCGDLDIPLVHVSTDYVFDGEFNQPIDESAKPNPLSVYGVTKLEGEKRVTQSLDNAYIIRTAWVYSTFGKNFVKTF